jgi:O-antigen ligase
LKVEAALGSENLGRLDFIFAAALLVVAIALGGGGSDFPVGSMAAQLLGLLLLGRLLLSSRSALRWHAARPEFYLGICIAGLVLLQLIPLPPEIWRSLPGRDLAADISDFTGTGSFWRPISLDPEASVYSALSLIPAAAIFLAAVTADAKQRQGLAYMVVGMALISGLLAMLQTAGAIEPLYETAHDKYAVGLFSNRNHQADLLLAGLILSVGVAAAGEQSRNSVVPAYVITLLLGAAVVATASRTGFALLALSALGSLLIVLSASARRKLLAARTLIYGLPLLGLVWLARNHPLMERLLVRFQSDDDLRFVIWSNSIDAIAAYFPVGSGLGTFSLVYPQVEDLDDISAGWINAAHNDALELVVETGLVGGALIAAFLLVFFRRASDLRKFTKNALERAACLAAFILILHSLVDYPLRTTSLLTVFGFLLGLMIPPALVRSETIAARGVDFAPDSQQSCQKPGESLGGI